METVIIICLLIIIFLLMQDQAANKKRSLEGHVTDVKNKKHQLIVGDTKRLNVSSKKELVEEVSRNEKFSAHIEDKNQQEKIRPTQIRLEELDEVFADPIDLEAEEEEWKKYGIMDNHTHLAQGVTFEEMNDIGELLRLEELSFVQKTDAVKVVQKIHGTELYHLLENSVEGASKKIAELLESSFSDNDKETINTHLKNDPPEFDIRQFI